MPCCQIITASVEFKAGNIDLLKKALEKEKWSFWVDRQGETLFTRKGKVGFSINFKDQKISATNMSKKELTTAANALKRAYSVEVITEIAKKNKWQQKKLNETHYQLVRY